MLSDGLLPIGEILETGIGSDNCNEAEIRWIAHFREINHLLNLSNGGDGQYFPSNEVRAKMSAGQKALWANPDHRKRMASSHRGKTLSDEHRMKLSAAQKLLWMSPEHQAKMASRPKPSAETRAKLRAKRQGRRPDANGHRFSPEAVAKKTATLRAFWSGHTHTPEALAKMRASALKQNTPEYRAYLASLRRGKKASAETRAKIAEAGRRGKGRPKSPEWCAKRSALMKGRTHTMETRAKMSAAKLSMYKQKREFDQSR